MSSVFDVTSIEIDQEATVDFGTVVDTVTIENGLEVYEVTLEAPTEVQVIEVAVENLVVSGGGSGGGVTDHGALTGLSDDDHTQYALADGSRGDFETAGAAAAAVSAHNSDTTDVHGITDTADIILEGDSRLTDARTPTAHNHDDRYYTETEVDDALTLKADEADVTTALAGKSDTGHTHDHGSLSGLTDDDHTQYHTDARGDARYYTKAQSDTALSGKSDTGHTHDDRYYTETETDSLLAGKSDSGHTHTSAQVTDLAEYIQDTVASTLVGSGVTLTYDDAAGQITIEASGGGTDLEAVRDAIGVALVGVGNISVTVDDAANTITIATTATQNSTDAALRDRSTHTGTQAISTVSGLQTALDGKSDTGHTHTASNISDSTAVGRSILTAADAAAVRSAAGAEQTLSGRTVDASSAVFAAGTTSGTGLKVGGATNQFLGFYNATPVSQQSATTDLGTALSNLGLRAAGTAYPITTSGAVSLTGTVTITGLLRAYTALSANTTLSTTHHFVGVDASAGNRTITLPTPVVGREYVVKKVDSSANTVTVVTGTPATHSINGTTGGSIVLSYQNQTTAVVGATTTAWQTRTMPLLWANIPDKPSTFAPSAHTHTSTDVTDFTEAVQDIVGAMIVAGSNVTATYNDGAGTLTIASTGGGGGSVAIADLPAGSVVYSTTTTRPTARTDICVFFVGDTDPGSNALDGDVWLRP